MRFAPNRIKKSAEMLGLTSEQEGAVDELIERSASARHEMMQAGMEGGKALSDLFDAEPLDTAAIRSAAMEAYQMHAAMHAQMLVDAAAVRTILTPAQREKALMATMSMGMGMSDSTMPRDSGHGHNRQ
jgi:Spy/CpxP family protein refolding chaperone